MSNNKSLLKVIEQCDNWPYSNSHTDRELNYMYNNSFELRLDDGITTIGLILPKVVELIKKYDQGLIEKELNPNFIYSERMIKFNKHLDQESNRTEAIKAMVNHWRENNLLLALKGWRDEIYPVYYTRSMFNDKVALSLERSSSWAFGVATFGVHINGFIKLDDGNIKVWIARRSLTKPTWPNMLDNMCAGGISFGDTIHATMIKECLEEGSIPEHLSSKAISVGAVTYTTVTGDGVSPETQYIYDLQLPVDFQVKPSDGEVGQFYLMDIQEIITRLHNFEFKPNCGLTMIDFLVRHGYLTLENEPNLTLIQARCHRLSSFVKF